MSNCFYSANGTLSCDSVSNIDKKNNIENFENSSIIQENFDAEKRNIYTIYPDAGRHAIDNKSLALRAGTLDMCTKSCDSMFNCLGVVRPSALPDSSAGECGFLTPGNMNFKWNNKDTSLTTFLNANGNAALGNFNYKTTNTYTTGTHILMKFEDSYMNGIKYLITTTDQGWGNAAGSTAEIAIVRKNGGVETVVWTSEAFLCTPNTSNNRIFNFSKDQYPLKLKIAKDDQLILRLKALYDQHIAKVTFLKIEGYN